MRRFGVLLATAALGAALAASGPGLAFGPRNTYGLQPEREVDVLMHHVLQTFGGTPNADCEVVLLY